MDFRLPGTVLRGHHGRRGQRDTKILDPAAGAVTYAAAYAPYGEVAQAYGTGSSYGYTGEMQDPTGMVYLRARYYSPITGQFLSRDTWEEVYDKPISLNRFLYTEANPVNNVDPTGFCRLSGWNGPPGTLFSEDTCDRLANIYRDAMGINATGAPSIEDLPVLHQWYSDLADAAERNGYVQGATNLRHFLDGSGTPLQLSAGFMQNDLWGWEYIQDQVNDLAVWFVRKKIHGLTAGCDTEVGPSGYARQINTDYKGLIHDPPAGVAGALGNFRLEVVISGSLNKLHRWSSRTATNLNLHLIVLDFYNWEEDNKAAVLIDGAYHTVPDDWALVLERWGYGKSFFVRGDTDISFTEDVKGQILNLPVSSSGSFGMRNAKFALG